ncbi:carbonic anhydrase [Consotaella salsifontis]|uniref:carbonic anhydrase n=1 Tax=Consotaella salsifontis TaxID=1365950 RepID=A0A1T4LB12_9HYPH|nr:carbonic anhydrase [Consotaella salsifontis]SJZ51744.1 carbonic anhydrase [Consotaella salsifontis]
MDRLLSGYRRFRAEMWPSERATYEALAMYGQNPHTLVIACSDSRVDPQRVFGAGPGEMFSVRNIAGLVPPYAPDSHHHGTSAAVEYAVRVLKVKRAVVLGHAQCGGVRAMAEGAPSDAQDFVSRWMEIAAPVLETIPRVGPLHELLPKYEAAVVRLSLANLRTFPWVAEAEEAGSLQVEGFQFDIHTGVLSRLAGEDFVAVDQSSF